MERRLLTFFVAWTALFILFTLFRGAFAPDPPPEAPAANPPAGQIAENDGEAAKAPVDSGTADSDSTDAVIPDRPEQAEWVTLGSMDAQSGYQLLVTLNSRGAGVERIEVTARNETGDLAYRRVDIRHGYLGYLGTRPGSDSGDSNANGARAGVVGPGTPADLAGIQVGDVLTQVNGTDVIDDPSIDQALLATEPGDQATIDLIRDGKPMTLTATLTEHPLDLVRLASTAGIDQVAGNQSRLSCLMTFAQLNRQSIQPAEDSIAGIANPADLVWTANRIGTDSSQTASFELPLAASELSAANGGDLTLRRSYRLQPGMYVIDMDLEIENRSEAEQDLAYRLEGPNGLTLEGWWYSNKISPNMFGGAAARDVIYRLADQSSQLVSGYELLKNAREEPQDPADSIFASTQPSDAPNIDFVGVDAQYFTVAYLPSEGQTTLDQFRRLAANVRADPEAIPRHKERAANTSFYLDSGTTPLAPGAKWTQKIRMFAGPKAPELLEPYGLGDAIYYGWFAYFSKFLGKILHLLSGTGNYAIAIILLTVMVRGLMFPFSRKAAVNAQKMQELAPEMKKIAEQYKDDMEGRLKAQQELQRRSGFNPLAGCAPMFLQLPVFIGLYRALSVDIELRQQPMIPGWEWASNLAGPDMFRFWADWLPEYFSGRGTGWLGPYFNLLPILVVVLFLAQQKMFMPPATDDQTRLTQRMMNIMTLMMGLFFFRVPAGLCVYFVTSSLWGIGERILVKKTLPPKREPGDVVLETPTGASPSDSTSSASLAQRLKDQISKPEPTFQRPNKRKRPKKK